MTEHSEDIAVLYVDDEEVNLFLFKTNFERDYLIFTASSGKEGLEVLETHRDKIIVVISDMRMPEMNGVEFIKKAKERYQNVVYFILTGYPSNDEIEAAIADKVIHQWFTKPLNMNVIKGAIDDALSELT